MPGPTPQSPNNTGTAFPDHRNLILSFPVPPSRTTPILLKRHSEHSEGSRFALFLPSRSPFAKGGFRGI